MTAQRPLRLKTCVSCGRNFYSRSTLSKYCLVQCQVREWRARNKFTQQELEKQFIAQELETRPPEQEVA
jgi:hypothetical protein